MVGPGGKLEPATVVATDTASDIALVDVPEDLPVAPFADDTTLSGGSPDLTLSFVPAGGTVDRAALHARLGERRRGRHRRRAGRRACRPSPPPPSAPVPAAGDPLLNTAGAVVGILYDARPRHGRPRHLPAQPARRRGGRRPALQGPGGPRVAGRLGHRRPRRHRGHGGAGGVQRTRRRSAAARAGDRRRRTRCPCARWPSCGRGSTSCPRAPPSPSRSSGGSGTKVVGITLGASS